MLFILINGNTWEVCIKIFCTLRNLIQITPQLMVNDYTLKYNYPPLINQPLIYIEN